MRGVPAGALASAHTYTGPFNSCLQGSVYMCVIIFQPQNKQAYSEWIEPTQGQLQQADTAHVWSWYIICVLTIAVHGLLQTLLGQCSLCFPLPINLLLF